MTESLIQYDNMVQMALLSVVRDVLHKTAEKGLLGDHHFYITFCTKNPNTRIPSYLKERYPDEMTIVIQNQFSGLLVDDLHFEISLSFSGKLEHLYIPFVALRGFFDPSVDFGLHFHSSEMENEMEHNELGNLQSIVLDQADQTSDAPENKDTTGKVVTLDTFRKK